MPFDPGPAEPFHTLVTNPDAVVAFINALSHLLDGLGEKDDLEIEASEAIRNYGFGRCRVTQIVVFWNPARSKLGLSELRTYAQTLALALGCEMLDLWVEPRDVDLVGPELLGELAKKPSNYGRLEEVLAKIKKRRSEAATVRLN